MKKVEIFIGSPRKKGNTEVMGGWFRDTAGADGALVGMHSLYSIDLNPCTDCRNCLNGGFVCTVNDGMQELYSRLDAADIIVFGTPIYWSGPTAPAKMILDRLRPYYRSKKLEGKTLALLLPAADGMPDCDLTIEMFRRAASLLGMSFAGAVTASAFDSGEIAGNAEVKKSVKELWRLKCS